MPVQRADPLKLLLIFGGRILAVSSLCISPALLNEVELAVKLWQEHNPKSVCFTDHLKLGFDSCEVGLIIEHTTDAAIAQSRCTLEALAFESQF